ncbi:MAG: single-stranded DNA-binding protein [Planctomycetes bacterium]|nr:single-stranded DNA-binding protein [Planctomycetota bacterium]
MNDYSLAILVGRLTRDPDLRYTNPGGIPYVRMSVAVNRQKKLENAEVRKEVSFVEITAWRRLAELCTQFLKKGRTVMVVGTLRQSRWIGKDGQPRTRLEVLADRVQFLSRKDPNTEEDESREELEEAAQASTGE